MARSEKRTRIKGLPPKIVLVTKAALTGSYPTVAHNGTTNRNLAWLPFNDQNVLNFTRQVSYFGLDFPTASNYIPSLTFVTTSLTGSLFIKAGIADSFISLQRYADISGSYQPFKDNDQFQADGKSLGNQNAFWATGSNIDGLREPIWSKTKLEINLTPLTASALTGSRGGNSYMGYYNFAQRKWTGVGGAARDPGDLGGHGGIVFEQFGGFSASHNRIYSLAEGSATSTGRYMNGGRPISSLGFPYSNTYNATTPFCFPMSNLINRPFVVEKILLEMSAAFRLSTLKGTLDETYEQVNLDPYYESGLSSSYVVNNFFILNQRQIPIQPNLHLFQEDPIYGNQMTLQYSPSLTSRDLVTWLEIASFNNDYNHVADAATYPNYFYRDYTIINSGSTASTTSSWSRNMIISGSVRSSKASVLNGFGQPASLTSVQDLIYDVSLGAIWMAVGWNGSRNGLLPTNVCGRDLLNAAVQAKGDKRFNPDSTERYFQIGTSGDDWSIPNPYVLMPGDNLVIGWQLPTTDSIAGAFNSVESAPSSSFIDFPATPARLVLYGSYLSEGDGTNTSNQVLSTDSVHEAIE